MKLGTGHPFDNEHGTAADRTAHLGGDLAISCIVVCSQQSTTACEHTATPAVGEKSEVADADQPLGQNVDQDRRRNSSAKTVMIFCLPPCA